MIRHKVKDSVNVCRIGWTLLEKEVEKSEPNKPSKKTFKMCLSCVHFITDQTDFVCCLWPYRSFLERSKSRGKMCVNT